ncbi:MULTISPECIES: TIGR03364 family FAD-dependent oxidoreductase [unclassified Variovorax]|uniref:TIGR03364 family FAD-dependent oxidoreductase n=1 Tax=unclassified Variovorax TaxID=663243 RepID=UPI002578EDBA|nr:MULTISPECIES: TIGR03364 family FAD-dependent oxidoreductase [unclassified Variovorax]MDM0088266.1 TIGR03364 family FAD-dependent oxidoreductase [Variovorax sp. J22G40]MDM0146339.1 TIGR03364 family FAD-dependent oxidoreductase [Variovorax sp. J2P1-31]
MPDATQHFDLIVVGAGIVGLAHAYTAAQRGLQVCVVERDAAAVGASIRNFGFITVTGQAPGDMWRRAMHSRAVWNAVAPQAGIDIVHRHLWLAACRPEAHAVLEAFLRTPMGEGCDLLDADDAQARAPALRLADAQSVLFSPHELRVESRTAIGLLTKWLAEAHGVVFRFGESVHEVDTPRVRTSRGTLHAERVVVCTHAELHGLFADRIAAQDLTLCRLQMLRVQPEAGFRLPGAVMTDLSLVRYEGYSTLPEAAALRARLQDEEAASLAHGIHLIVVQSADGSLVVGDSHHYADAPEPFAMEAVDQLILRHLRSTLNLEAAQVTERWTGVYPSSKTTPCVIDAPDDATRVVLVTSGSGASTGFGIAHDVFEAW